MNTNTSFEQRSRTHGDVCPVSRCLPTLTTVSLVHFKAPLEIEEPPHVRTVLALAEVAHSCKIRRIRLKLN